MSAGIRPTEQQRIDLYAYMKKQGIHSDASDEAGAPVYILHMGDVALWLFSDGSTDTIEEGIEYPWNQAEFAL